MRKIGVKIVGIMIVATLILQSNVAIAAVSSEEQQLRNEQQEIENKQSQAQQDLENVQTQKSETVQQVEQLSIQISDYEAQIDVLDGQISQLNGKIEESEEKIKKAEEDYKKQQELLDARIVATYEAGETSYLDFLLSSESITDLISNYYLITEVATNDTELLEKIQKQKQEIEQAKKELEADKQELATSRANKQSMSSQLQTAKKQKDQQVAQLTEDEKKIQEHIQELRTASAQIEKDIRVAQEKYRAQVEALNKKKQNGQTSGGNASSGGTYQSGGSGVLQKPVQSGQITATMTYSDGSYHGAIDYGVPSGTPVYAAADGIVFKTANLTTSYGTYVVIQHAGGLQTWYAHGTSGSICVSEGQEVSRGQQIMRSGNSGNSTGPHLHFEVRVAPYNYNNCRVDPRNYF